MSLLSNLSFRLGLCVSLLLVSVSCSTTDRIPSGEQLYLGIDRISYDQQELVPSSRNHRVRAQTDSTGVITAVADALTAVDAALNGTSPLGSSASPLANGAAKERDQRRADELRAKESRRALAAAKTEIDAVLAYAPNGALFGSSSLTSPFKFGLWAYNRYVDSHTRFGKWMFRSFAEAPILISNVAPQTRSKVAANTLRNYGFFRATASYELLAQRNPQKAKLAYHIQTGPLFRLDSIAYIGFEQAGDSLLSHQLRQGVLKKNEAFSTLRLTQEQNRIDKLLRNNGYYYFQNSYTQFHADTTARPEHVQLRILLNKNRPHQARRPWYIGRSHVTFLTSWRGDEATDSIVQGDHTYVFPRGKMPLRSFMLRYGIAHRHGQRYSLDDQEATLSRLYGMGIFANTELDYTPRDSSATCDTLDVNLRLRLDKVYDSALEMYAHFKSNQQMGPGLSYELSRRNAFRGAETVSLKLFGSYEWQLGSGRNAGSSLMNSYELGTELSFKFPRLLVPWLAPNYVFRKFMRRLAAHRAEELRTGVARRFVFSRSRPIVGSTTFALNVDWQNRAKFFQVVNFGASYSYKWYRNPYVQHELVLPRIEFNRLLNTTTTFDSIVSANPALYVSVRNQLVPSVSYSLTRNAPAGETHPYWWQLTLKEAGNLLAAGYALGGRGFSETDKRILGTPFAQFLKATAELHYTRRLNAQFKLATRLFVGAVYSYGNATSAPYAEQFYVGGANSVRGFSVRTVGPGGYYAPRSAYSYIDQTGDFKLEGNLELRSHLFGSLHGAVFLDAGNVWLLRAESLRSGGELSLSNLRRLAVGTGFGLRYDLQFIVMRFDVGIGLHAPYSTSRSGFYNLERFRDGFAFHFAIGYPF